MKIIKVFANCLLLLFTTTNYAQSPVPANEIACPKGSAAVGSPPPFGVELKCQQAVGSLHGPYLYWYGNGQLMQELHYKNGREHGSQRSWWPNGQLMILEKSVRSRMIP